MLWPFVHAITAAVVVSLPWLLVRIPSTAHVIDPFFTVFAVQVVAFALVAAVLRVRPSSLKVEKISADGSLAVLWLLLAELAIAILFFSTLVATASSGVGNSVYELIGRYSRHFPHTGLAGAVFGLGVLAPILEEFVFRGLILGYVLRSTRPWVAVVFSSLLFGAAHGSAWPFPTLLGILYAFLYLRYQSVWLCVIAHACSNLLIAGATPLLIAWLNESYPGLGIKQHLIWFQVTCCLVSISFLFMFFREARAKPRRSQQRPASVSKSATTA